MQKRITPLIAAVPLALLPTAAWAAISCFPAYGIGNIDGLALVPLYIMLEILLLTSFFGYHRRRTVWAIMLWALLTWPLTIALSIQPCKLEGLVAAMLHGVPAAQQWSMFTSWFTQFAVITIIKIVMIASTGARRPGCKLWLPAILAGLASHILLAAWLLLAWMGSPT
ncbi:hypothetical protein GC177_06655 [bacterium]|nr:hypothetical protein [bacterium]